MTVTDDEIALAAEYVLGTLDAAELAQAAQRIAAEPAFAALVGDWERRLGELNAMVAPIEPPADMLEKILAKLASATQDGAMFLPDPAAARPAEPLRATRSSEVLARTPRRGAPGDIVPPQPHPDQGRRIMVLSRRASRWRAAGVTFAALAVGFAAVMVTSLVSPDLLPEQLRPTPRLVEVIKTVETVAERPAEKPNRFIGVLQKDAASPAFLLTVDLESRSMTVRRVAADSQPGKSFELWLVSSQLPAPRSLGLVGDKEFTAPAQLANYDRAMISDADYAVSLEPEGGSPTGFPTGPVLWSGKLLETAPPAR
jgi:anti-sigma-K factor RskA